MTDLEQQARDLVPAAKLPRFEFLLAMRDQVARTSAELFCWGVADTPGLDRHLVLLEDALDGMIPNAVLAASLRTQWAISDAELLHIYGEAGWCPVCTDDQTRLLTTANWATTP